MAEQDGKKDHSLLGVELEVEIEMEIKTDDLDGSQVGDGGQTNEDKVEQNGEKKGEDKVEQNGEKKGEDKVEQNGEKKGEDKVEQNGEKKGEDKVEQNGEKKGEDKVEQNGEKKGEEIVEQNGEKKGEEIVEQNGENKGEEKVRQKDERTCEEKDKVMRIVQRQVAQLIGRIGGKRYERNVGRIGYGGGGKMKKGPLRYPDACLEPQLLRLIERIKRYTAWELKRRRQPRAVPFGKLVYSTFYKDNGVRIHDDDLYGRFLDLECDWLEDYAPELKLELSLPPDDEPEPKVVKLVNAETKAESEPRMEELWNQLKRTCAPSSSSEVVADEECKKMKRVEHEPIDSSQVAQQDGEDGKSNGKYATETAGNDTSLAKSDASATDAPGGS